MTPAEVGRTLFTLAAGLKTLAGTFRKRLIRVAAPDAHHDPLGQGQALAACGFTPRSIMRNLETDEAMLVMDYYPPPAAAHAAVG
jgi:hypothetical protein